MLKLYHGSTSVCSAKVRVGLAELGLKWSGPILNLAKGDQHAESYLKLNPKGVVPTLMDGEFVVTESSVILEYLVNISANSALVPITAVDRAKVSMWLSDCIDIHAAINTMTFATSKRLQILESKTPRQIETSIAKIAHPANAAKRRDIIQNGVASVHVDIAFFTLVNMFSKMQSALADARWLVGNRYSLADIALIAYLDRLDRLGLAGLWQDDFTNVAHWLENSRKRSSYQTAIEDFAGPAQSDRENGLHRGNWTQIAPLWRTHLAQQT